jgi:hypothetical protein
MKEVILNMDWRIKPEKLKDFENAYKQRKAGGIAGEINIAKETQIPENTVRSMMRGEWFRDTHNNLRRLFAPLVVAGCDEQLTVDILIDEYCEKKTIPGKKEPKVSVPFDPPMDHLLIYVKFLHLRDRRSAAPVYRKFVSRLKQTIDVFDEFILIKTLSFKEMQKHQEFYSRSMGVVDIQPVFPPRDHAVGPDPGLLNVAHVVRHFETEPSQIYQTITFYENGLQYGNEEIGGVVADDCARAVLMADMTSLPCWSDALFAAPPVAYHLRPEIDGIRKKRMSCWQTSAGIWVMDSARPGEATDTQAAWNPQDDILRKNDKLEMHFSLRWDVVNLPQVGSNSSD